MYSAFNYLDSELFVCVLDGEVESVLFVKSEALNSYLVSYVYNVLNLFGAGGSKLGDNL